MIRKDAWDDFSFFEFTKARFMAQDVIYPGEGFMSTWEKGEIHLSAHAAQFQKNKWPNQKMGQRTK